MKWLKEPLVHFMVLGALVFAGYALTRSGMPGTGEIVVTRGQQEHLLTTFSRTWQRPPTQQEFSALVDDWIREEIAYREGRRMGLDENDTIIRRRLRQKLEMLAEDVVSLAQPDDTVLQAWLEQHQQDYQQEPRYTLQQVYFSRDRRGEAAAADAEQALVLLDAGDALVDPATLGDPLPLPSRLTGERIGSIAAQFGSIFATGISDLPTGRWQGPVESGFGLHLVRIEEVVPGRALGLDEARAAVLRDWQGQQRRDTLERLYQRLAEQYSVTIEPMPAGGG